MMGWVKMFPRKGKHYKTFAHHNLVQTCKKSKGNHLKELVNVYQYLGKRHYFQVPTIEWMSVYPHPHHRDSHASLIWWYMEVSFGEVIWQWLEFTLLQKKPLGVFPSPPNRVAVNRKWPLTKQEPGSCRSVGSKYPSIIWAPSLWYFVMEVWTA